MRDIVHLALPTKLRSWVCTTILPPFLLWLSGGSKINKRKQPEHHLDHFSQHLTSSSSADHLPSTEHFSNSEGEDSHWNRSTFLVYLSTRWSLQKIPIFTHFLLQSSQTKLALVWVLIRFTNILLIALLWEFSDRGKQNVLFLGLVRGTCRMFRVWESCGRHRMSGERFNLLSIFCHRFPFQTVLATRTKGHLLHRQDLHWEGAGDGCINQVSLTDMAAWLSCVKVSGGEFVLYYLPWPASRSFHYIHYAIHIWIIMRRSLAARNLKSFLENDCILWQHNGSHIKN